MNARLLISASALALGLALSTTAVGQVRSNTEVEGGDNLSATSTNTDSSTYSDSSTNTKTEDSGNTKTDSSTNTKNEDSFNTKTWTDNSVNTKTEDSGNTKTEDSNNTKTDYDKSFNTDNSVSTKDSNNTKTYTDNSVHTKTTTISKQDLDGEVSGIAVNFASTPGQSSVPGGCCGDTLTTGGIDASGAAFSGIQTASLNTGVGSLNQAATSLAANANISFGGP